MVGEHGHGEETDVVKGRGDNGAKDASGHDDGAEDSEEECSWV